MSYLNALLTDLRDRKLWPVPLVLLAALVAVPVLLSKSPAPQHPAPIAGLSVVNGQTGSAVTVDDTPVQAPLAAGGRDPFTQQKLPGATSSAGTGSTATTASAGSTGSTGSGSTVSSRTGSVSSTGSTASTSSTGGNSAYTGGGSSTGSGGGSTGGTTTTPSHPVAPTGLQPTEAYHVSLSITDKSGGVTPLDPFERDGALPSDQHPMLVELGVAQSGSRVLYAVQRGTIVSGPGTCTPGPLDCEVLSLAAGQTENIAVQGGAVPSALFQITGISVDRYGSEAAASAARAKTDPVGRKLLADSTSNTLSLFQFDPSLDAVVDQRNLTVGGN